MQWLKGGVPLHLVAVFDGRFDLRECRNRVEASLEYARDGVRTVGDSDI
jgi:hypothetical protein